MGEAVRRTVRKGVTLVGLVEACRGKPPVGDAVESMLMFVKMVAVMEVIL